MLAHAELARLAGAAYRGPWSGRVAIDCKYDLLPRPEEVVVVIPGTNPRDAVDWIRDADARPRSFDTVGICHAGFGSGAEALFPMVEWATRGETRLLSVVGHSLGGAMALGVGARLIAAGRRVRIVTFGAPRVAFCLNMALGRLAWQAGELVEYRRAGDPVPHLPTRPFYRHVTGGLEIGSALPEALGVFDEIVRKIGNHDIARYAADLAALGR